MNMFIFQSANVDNTNDMSLWSSELKQVFWGATNTELRAENYEMTGTLSR